MRAIFQRRLKTPALIFFLLAWGGTANASGLPDGAPGAAGAKARTPQSCEKIVLTGEVSAGHEWKAAFGEGWIFRVVPIPDDRTAPGVGGWDLVVDRGRPAGYPDALLLASPPYHIINEREIATTFGLRAQDALGWNPRKFRFMTSRQAFREAHRLFLQLDRSGAFSPRPAGDKDGRKEKALKRKMQRFLTLSKESSPGEFRILDARLTPGEGMVKPYAVNWAQQSASTPHTDAPPPGGQPTSLGDLQWMGFSVTLWVPQGWKTPSELHAEQASCSNHN